MARARSSPFDPALAGLPPEARWRAWMGHVEAVLFVSAVPVPRETLARVPLSRVLGKEVSRDMIGRLKRLDLLGAGPRAPEPGAPLTYVTPSTFLARFGLVSLRDLPDIEALQEAGLLGPDVSADVPSDPFDAMLGLSDEEV